MAKPTDTPKTPDVPPIEESAIAPPELKEAAPEPEKTFEVLCEKGEFGYFGKMYHHDGLDYATAEYLVSIGYPYIKLN